MARNDSSGSHSLGSSSGDDDGDEQTPADAPTPIRDPRRERIDRGARVAEYNREDQPRRSGRPDVVEEQRVLPAKTSAAAAFALIFGVSALIAALTIILAPVALVLSVVGIVLGFIGRRMATRVGVTGRFVALGGLILSVVALLLAITMVAGVTTVLNNRKAVDRINTQVQKLEKKLPSKVPTK